MSAEEACRIMSDIIGPSRCISLPMADGGEGTAACVGRLSPGWEMLRPGSLYNELTRTVVVDSASIIGLDCFSSAVSALDRSSASLGTWLNETYFSLRPHKIYIGVGGTATCDGGAGMLRELAPTVPWRNILSGLIDVEAPLLPTLQGQISALSFCAQKGFSPEETIEAEKRLKRVIRQFGVPLSRFDGAGGGLGYALAGVIGAHCTLGAEWILSQAGIPWKSIDCVITGEGRFDGQSVAGKVVSTIARVASGHGIETVCMAGCTDGTKASSALRLSVWDLSAFYPHKELTPQTARERLKEACRRWIDYNL